MREETLTPFDEASRLWQASSPDSLATGPEACGEPDQATPADRLAYLFRHCGGGAHPLRQALADYRGVNP